MFYCREKELGDMNRRYAKNGFECLVVYGRRRVGKTALINEFCKNKPTVFFSALNATSQENLEALSKAIYEKEHPNTETAPVYPSFDAAFAEITRMAENERLVFVIDEYPYLARANKSISSRLQHIIDHTWTNSNLFLILCGSSMSFMEYQVLGYESPLYGRRTGQYKLQALTYKEMTVFNPEQTDENQALIYGITGGIPHYINKLDVEGNVDVALKENLFNTSSYLYEEPENLLKQEVREPALYNAIITAIAGGASRMSEISGKVGENTSVCSSYIKNLMALGLVKKDTPYGEKESRKSVYAIADHMFRFWYRFIPENSSVIGRGAADLAYRRIAPHLADFMGKVFEDICQEYLWKLLLDGTSPVEFSSLGRWWGTDPSTRRQEEIDIMGEQDNKTALFGECKWRQEPVDVGVLETLVNRSRLFHYSKVELYLIAKIGFTSGCMEQAEQMGNVHLVTYQDILNALQPEKNNAKKEGTLWRP